MDMMKITAIGTAPLLMHSCVGVNPTHPLTIKKKALTGKRKKTEEDTLEILDIDYLLGLYHDDEVGPYIPAENVEACLREAAKKRKLGKVVQSAIMVSPDRIPLLYDGSRDKDELVKDMNFRDVRPAGIQRNKILACRPRFNHWSIEFEIAFDDTQINPHELAEIAQVAGLQCGLCDYRPRYGKFTVVVK